MDFKNFKTGEDDISRRVDNVIRAFARNLSLAEIYKGIRKGLIRINNHKTKSDYRIQEKDVISIADFLINKKNDNINNFNNDNKINKQVYKMPEIIFENKHILIINKPYNVNVHGDINSLDKIIEDYYNKKNINNSLSFRPGPMHRLDKKTTGLIAFSMSLEGARWFSENIKNHTIQKKYYGLVEGIIEKKEEWTDLINNDKTEYTATDKHRGNKRAIYSNFHTVYAKEQNKKSSLIQQNEKTAITIVTPVSTGIYNGRQVTLVQFHIKTGRKHQIRAQSSLHGHPLLGDTAYGSYNINHGNTNLSKNNNFQDCYQDFYLTAAQLIFPKENPLGLPETLEIKLPKSFINILKHCGIEKSSV